MNWLPAPRTSDPTSGCHRRRSCCSSTWDIAGPRDCHSRAPLRLPRAPVPSEPLTRIAAASTARCSIRSTSSTTNCTPTYRHCLDTMALTSQGAARTFTTCTTVRLHVCTLASGVARLVRARAPPAPDIPPARVACSRSVHAPAHYDCNYGTPMVPFDKLFGTYEDGSKWDETQTAGRKTE